ncbi:MAG: hypothetical protein AAF269_14050 [Pseudomonadota bacterium]
MSFWNKTLAAIALTLTLGAPAFADGTPGQRVNRGPAPVQAHQPIPPEPGCYLIENGQAWSCPARPQKAPMKQVQAKPCCGTVTRTVVKEHPPVVTKRSVTHRTAPPQRTVTRRATTTTHRTAPPRRVATRRVETTGVQLDMASFSGGVGNGVDGGFYGGGGTLFISSGRSYSGVLSHGASRFTFRGHRGGKRRGGGGGECGCMGGGMGGGD